MANRTRSRSLAFLLLLSAAGCASVGEEYFLYTDREYKNGAVYGRHPAFGPDLYVTGGSIASGQRKKRLPYHVDWDHWGQDRLYDCSDDAYRCIYTHYRVFAVPREGLKGDSIYVVGGSVLRVERCIQERDNQCIEALISSDCQLMLDEGACAVVPGGREASEKPGPVGYFVYNGSIGITSFGDVNDPATNLAVKAKASTESILRSTSGLLSDEWAARVSTSKATVRTK